MSLMRPGTKIPFWSPKFTYLADVSPPFLLRLIAGLALCSVAGVLVYGVVLALDHAGSVIASPTTGLYIATLHFLLPLGISYTVFSNSPWSRPLLAAYVLVLSTATALGHGLLGTLSENAAVRVSSAFFAASTTLYWLFRNPRMRVYFARIGGRQVSSELQEHAEQLEAASGPGVRARLAIEWLIEWVELLILLGFIATVFFALHSMSV